MRNTCFYICFLGSLLLLTENSLAQKQTYSQSELKQLIIPASADRNNRFNAVEFAIINYPEKAPGWIAEGLTYTPDLEVADFLLTKLEKLANPKIIKYLSLYRPQNEILKNRVITLSEKISGMKYPDYALAIINKDQSSFDQYEFQIIIDNGRIWENLKLKNDTAEKWVQSITPANTFTRSLRFCLDEFDYIPSTIFEIVQFRKLEKETPDSLKEFKGKISNLNDSDYRFSIGDTGLIKALPIEILELPRLDLEKFITRYTTSTKHVSRPAAYRKAVNDSPDNFAGQKEKLTITDLLRIKLIIDYLFQGDHSDIISTLNETSVKSEIGGLIHYRIDKLSFQYYQPGKAIGQHRYIESEQLLKDSFNAISRWHIHDQRNTGRNLAGPGIDDINYATSLKTSIIIITLLENTNAGITANFDFVSKDGIIIDIGTHKL